MISEFQASQIVGNADINRKAGEYNVCMSSHSIHWDRIDQTRFAFYHFSELREQDRYNSYLTVLYSDAFKGWDARSQCSFAHSFLPLVSATKHDAALECVMRNCFDRWDTDTLHQFVMGDWFGQLPETGRVAAYIAIVQNPNFNRLGTNYQNEFILYATERLPKDAPIQVVQTHDDNKRIVSILVAAPKPCANLSHTTLYRLEGGKSIQSVFRLESVGFGSSAANESAEDIKKQHFYNIGVVLNVAYMMSQILGTCGYQMTPALSKQMEADINILAPDGIPVATEQVLSRIIRLAYVA